MFEVSSRLRLTGGLSLVLAKNSALKGPLGPKDFLKNVLTEVNIGGILLIQKG